MTRNFLIVLPALVLLAGCESPGDGTTQSETETVTGDDGTMAAPGDMSTDGSGTMNDGAATTTMPDSNSSTTEAPGDAPPVGNDMDSGETPPPPG